MIERTSKKRQTLLLPEYKVFSVWTNLKKVSDADILHLYRDRATCEQYFAELKSKLDLQRLPSGKFRVNELLLQLGSLVNNIQHVLGESLLDSGIFGLKKASRRRLRTIILGLMSLSGRFVRHARRVIVKVVSHGAFGEALVGMQRRLAQALKNTKKIPDTGEVCPKIVLFPPDLRSRVETGERASPNRVGCASRAEKNIKSHLAGGIESPPGDTSTNSG